MKKTIVQAGAEFFKDKKVLVRVDFNVPQNADGSVADDSRIKAALKTIEFLANAKAKVILVSHLGRPKGKDQKFSMAPVAKQLQALVGNGIKVHVANDCVGEEAQKVVDALKPGEVCLLENVRFYPEEEKNDAEFAKKLASLADVYVNDAFGTAHRAHASTEGVAHLLHPALAGFLIDKEVQMLGETLDNPVRPFATIIGGSKVSSKIGVLENLLSRVDVMIIGGAMAFSFLKARGLNVGKSLVEDDRLDYCRKLEEQAKAKGVKLILPVDVICAKEIKEGAESITVDVEHIPADQMGLDLGPKTSALIDAALKECKTILWNGPLGVFEVKGFEKATFNVVDQLVALTAKGVKTIVGGGDSVAALGAKNVPESALTHVSTGGGASLEFIEGLVLPGIASLDDAENAVATAGKTR
ncbi:MAG: phosphoglycerate kinase [Candidatus Obscuribacterales bacterium]|nr:phosphoglycerate kinase [Candidatus Obscuribacterales bacterium]